MADFTVETYSVVLAPNRAKVILYESEDITPDTRRVVLLLEPGAVGGPVEDDGTRVTAHMRLSMLDKLVDLLRNEEPVRVVWWPTHAYVYAGPEPVGGGIRWRRERGDQGDAAACERVTARAAAR